MLSSSWLVSAQGPNSKTKKGQEVKGQKCTKIKKVVLKSYVEYRQNHLSPLKIHSIQILSYFN